MGQTGNLKNSNGGSMKEGEEKIKNKKIGAGCQKGSCICSKAEKKGKRYCLGVASVGRTSLN